MDVPPSQRGLKSSDARAVVLTQKLARSIAFRVVFVERAGSGIIVARSRRQLTIGTLGDAEHDTDRTARPHLARPEPADGMGPDTRPSGFVRACFQSLHSQR